jgi:5-formyltetrahydrofolate cyclo-ligase
MNKAEMRKTMTAYLGGLGPAEIEAWSTRIAEYLTATAEWRAADTVLCFLSMPHEIDTTPLIAAARAWKKTVAVPLMEAGEIRFVVLPPGAGGNRRELASLRRELASLRRELASLARDRWGIPVPDPAWPAIDLARAARPLVAAPGLAFDRLGNRLGRGKGYYDRFLRRARAGARGLIVLGICFSGQVLEEVPHGADDQRVDGVVTEKGRVEGPGAATPATSST